MKTILKIFLQIFKKDFWQTPFPKCLPDECFDCRVTDDIECEICIHRKENK